MPNRLQGSASSSVCEYRVRSCIVLCFGYRVRHRLEFGVQGLVLNRLVVWVQGSASSCGLSTGFGPASSSVLRAQWGTGSYPATSGVWHVKDP